MIRDDEVSGWADKLNEDEAILRTEEQKRHIKDLEESLIAFTEYNLATLEELQITKATKANKSGRIERQNLIVTQMVRRCSTFCKFDDNRLYGKTRLIMKLKEINGSS